MKSAAPVATVAAILAFAFATTTARAQPFQLTSPDFGPDKPFGEKFVFHGMGCSGGNLSPALQWDNPPAGTKSFVAKR